MAILGAGGNDIRIRYLADTTQVGTATAEMGSGISKGLGLANIGWAAAGAAAVSFAKDSVQAAEEAEDAQNRLAASYAKFPALHDVTLKSLNDLADATLKKTRFDDEAARAAEGVLAQYHLTGAQLEQLLPLVEDYAAKTGKDLPSAAQAIGKALLGNTRALKDVGISYKSTGDAATDFANIVALLGQQVGGFAEKDAATTSGKLAQLSNQFHELEESVGTALLPLIQAIVPSLIQILQALTPVFQLLGTVMKWLSDNGLLMTVMFGAAIGPMAIVLDHTDLLTGAIATLGGWFTTAGYIIRNVFGAALEWVTGALSVVWGVVSSVAGVVGGVFAGAWNAAVGAINAVGSAIGWVIDKLHALKSVWDSVGGVISKIGGIIGLSAPAPPPGASGAPALALAGSGTARAVSGGGGAASAAGLTVNVNVHGNVGDPNLIGRRVVDALATYTRTNGTRALRTNLGLS